MIKKYFNSLSRYDYLLIFGSLILLVLAWGAEFYACVKEDDWPSLFKLSDYINHVQYVYNFFIWTAIGVCISTVIRRLTNTTKDKSWRYFAIIAFSLVGSVTVALITSDTPFQLPHIWAFAISLFHFGYWCWKREHIENSEYQLTMKLTTQKLEKMLSTMPDESAFKVMGDDTSSIFETISMLSVMSQMADNKSKRDFIAEEAINQIKKALNSMCQIASLWTVSRARLFEANIMLVISSSDVHKIPRVEEALKNGAHFFPDLTTLENISGMCERVLYAVPELAINTESGQDAEIKPLLLPVGLLSKMIQVQSEVLQRR